MIDDILIGLLIFVVAFWIGAAYAFRLINKAIAGE